MFKKVLVQITKGLYKYENETCPHLLYILLNYYSLGFRCEDSKDQKQACS
jgi:hypothetical protein